MTTAPRPLRSLAALMVALTSACASAPDPAPEDVWVPGPQEHRPELPPIPPEDGPLDLRISYPRDSMAVAVRDSNFIFGSTGNGSARVWINDQPVEVQPNGGFLGFLPVPDDGVYRIRATLGDQTDQLSIPVQLPALPPQVPVGAAIIPGSGFPSGGWVVLPGERIEAGFRGTADGVAWLELSDGTRFPLIEESEQERGGATDFEVSPGAVTEQAQPSQLSTYRGFFTARRIAAADTTVYWPALAVEARPGLPRDTLFTRRELEAAAPPDQEVGVEQEDRPLGAPVEEPIRAAVAGEVMVARGPAGGQATLVLVARGDTVRQPLPLNMVLADPQRPRVGVAYDPDPPADNGDDHINGRPGPGGGPYHYTWRNGTEMELTGERNGIYRVRLTDDLDAWTPSGDVVLRPAGAAPPVSRVATVRMDPQPRYIDVHLAMDRRMPYRVDQDDRTLSLSVYGATSRANFLQHGRVDPYIERAEWIQVSDRLFRLDIHLTSIPWGYEALWQGDDLVLRLRRPPEIDPDQPLRGLRIGVDPGHGGGDRFTMGPTGFTEADANLGIALALRDLLQERGAEVVMTRETDATRSLVERTHLARQRDVDVLVSVHNNAFPDGVNPWENSGTSVYYNHAPSADLAWSVHEELLEELGLRDLGVGRADLHLARFSWSPAILTETSFMMIPAQEAFLKSQEGQRRIAEAHVRGVQEWLRGLAVSRSSER